jgi:hypothetical protein
VVGHPFRSSPVWDSGGHGGGTTRRYPADCQLEPGTPREQDNVSDVLGTGGRTTAAG